MFVRVLFRKMPDILNPDEFSAKMAYLLEEKDLGICLAVVTLLDGIVSVGDYRNANYAFRHW